MGRCYDLTITDTKGKPIVDSKGKPIGPISSTISSEGRSGALDIEFDVLTLGSGVIAASTSTLVIRGLPMSVLKQSVNLAKAVITLNAGFDKVGLPLGVNQSQYYGMIMKGQAWAPYAQWQGVNQSLNIAMSNYVAESPDTFRIIFDGKNGEVLKDVIERNLNNAFPNNKLTFKIREDLVLVEDMPAVQFKTIASYAEMVNEVSRSLANIDDYMGINIYMQKDFIVITDFTRPIGNRVINVTELIGQPTWVNINTVSIKVPMRADMNIGDSLTILNPQTKKPFSPYDGVGQILTTGGENAYLSQMKDITFSGSFLIQSIRHVGAFRNNSADSWVTIIEAIGLISTTKKGV